MRMRVLVQFGKLERASYARITRRCACHIPNRISHEKWIIGITCWRPPVQSAPAGPNVYRSSLTLTEKQAPEERNTGH